MQPSTRPLLTPARYLEVFDAEARAFTDLVRTADLHAAVPSCPGWDLAALTEHVGRVHGWAASKVTGTKPGTPPLPAEPEAVADWYQQSASALLDVLAAADPQQACWTLDGDGVAIFWMRRQAHEITVHRRDAQPDPGPPESKQAESIAPDVAADGVAEIADMFFPRQVRLDRLRPLPDVLAIDLVDVPGQPLLIGGDGVAYAAPAATLRGPAEAVLLALWRRLPVADARLQITGSVEAAERVLSADIVP